MSFRFIYGRAGSGRSYYCLDDIKENLEAGGEHPLILLVPDQYSFQAEKNLMKVVKTDEFMRARVLSFKRMAYRVFTEVGGITREHMNPAGRLMLIFRIMESLKDRLTVYSKAAYHPGFVNTVSDMIVELKRYCVTPEMLSSTAESVEDEMLKRKLADMSLIFGEFEKALHENYIDSEDDMDLLVQKLSESKQFDGAEIYVDEFASFTPQQYGVIKELAKKARRINITLCTDCLDIGSLDNTDIFFTIKSTVSKILDIAREIDETFDKPVYLDGKDSRRFRESPEIAHIEKHLFSYPYKEYSGDVESIRIFKAINKYSEVEETARDIVSLVRDQKVRYNHIAIAGRNMENYQSLISSIFEEYGIPYFIDEKRDITNNPIIVLIVSAIEILSKNWAYEPVFRYLKTYLTGMDREDVDLLENYVLMNGIRGSKWFETWEYRLHYSFEEEPLTEYEKKTIDRVNKAREEIVGPLKAFYGRVSRKHKAEDVCAALFNFLCEIKLPEKIEERIIYFKSKGELDLMSQYSRVWDILVDVLDQVVEVMGDQEVTLDEFYKVLTIGFGEYDIGLIPPSLDQVLVSTVDRMKSHEVKYLYIIGINDGVFPQSLKDEGMFNDSDREMLKDSGVELPQGAKAKTFEEQYIVYTTLSSAERSIRISYPIADHEGKTMRPSILISRLKKLFPKMMEESNIIKGEYSLNSISSPLPTFNGMVEAIRGNELSPLWEDVYRWYAKDDSWKDRCGTFIDGLSYTSQVNSINYGKARRLYGNPMYFSVSRLEKYAWCPFSYFVQYGLRAKERKVFEFSLPDLGTFMHNVLERFAKDLQKENMDWREVEKEYCRESVSYIVDDMIAGIPGYILSSSPRYKYMAERLKRILVSAIWIIVEHIKRSGFEVESYETSFGNNGDYPPINIKLSSGEEINLIGRIDRIDVMEKDEDRYIRIIDYKSSDKKLKLSDVYYGLQLQLLTYLDAILESAKREGKERLHPAGILYFKIDDPIIKVKGPISDEEIERAIIKSLKMKGLILDNVDVVKEMDRQIGRNSDIIPAGIKDDGTLSASSSATDEEHFEALMGHVKKTIVSIGEEMVKGGIAISPYKNKDKTPCKYCSYSAICQFDTRLRDNKYRILNDKKDDEVWSLIMDEGGEANG